MRRKNSIVAGGLALLVAAPVAAQNFTLKTDLFGQTKPAAPKPPAVDWSRGQATDPNAAAAPKVVCGMTVVPADPKVDPKMRVAPKDDGVKYVLKVVPPAVCSPSSQK
jgi:hypothetical protein